MGMENKFPEYLCQQACRLFITRICRIPWELLHTYIYIYIYIFFFFALTLPLPDLPWLGELPQQGGGSVPSRSHSTAGLRSCTPHSDRRGCTGRWPWVACPRSSAAAVPSAWTSGAGSSDRRSGRAAWGQCWRRPRAQTVTPGCSVPHTGPGVPSGERKETVTARACVVSRFHCDSMDCSPPGSSVHGILQARILEWIAMPSSRRSFGPRDRTYISYVSCIGRRVLYY